MKRILLIVGLTYSNATFSWGRKTLGQKTHPTGASSSHKRQWRGLGVARANATPPCAYKMQPGEHRKGTSLKEWHSTSQVEDLKDTEPHNQALFHNHLRGSRTLILADPQGRMVGTHQRAKAAALAWGSASSTPAAADDSTQTELLKREALSIWIWSSWGTSATPISAGGTGHK